MKRALELLKNYLLPCPGLDFVSFAKQNNKNLDRDGSFLSRKKNKQTVLFLRILKRPDIRCFALGNFRSCHIDLHFRVGPAVDCIAVLAQPEVIVLKGYKSGISEERMRCRADGPRVQIVAFRQLRNITISILRGLRKGKYIGFNRKRPAAGDPGNIVKGVPEYFCRSAYVYCIAHSEYQVTVNSQIGSMGIERITGAVANNIIAEYQI